MIKPIGTHSLNELIVGSEAFLSHRSFSLQLHVRFTIFGLCCLQSWYFLLWWSDLIHWLLLNWFRLLLINEIFGHFICIYLNRTIIKYRLSLKIVATLLLLQLNVLLTSTEDTLHTLELRNCLAMPGCLRSTIHLINFILHVWYALLIIIVVQSISQELFTAARVLPDTFSAADTLCRWIKLLIV